MVAKMLNIHAIDMNEHHTPKHSEYISLNKVFAFLLMIVHTFFTSSSI